MRLPRRPPTSPEGEADGGQFALLAMTFWHFSVKHQILQKQGS